MFHLRAVVLVLVIMVSWSSTAISQTFSQSDLEGDWWGAGIASGDDPLETPMGMYFDLTVDIAGSATGNATAFYGSGSTTIAIPPFTLDISSAGIITGSSDPTSHGILSGTTDLFAYTHTDDGYHLKIGIKPVRSNFATSELLGDWRGCQVVSGDAPGDDPRCGHGEITFNNQGEITTGTWTTYSSGVSTVEPVSGVTFEVDTDGTFHPISGVTSMKGVLNANVDVMTFMDAESSVSGYSLFFMMRDTGATFNVADLQGTWTAHSVFTGDRPNITPSWSYATIKFDDSGNFTVRSTDPSGTGTDSGQVSLSTEGLITIPGENIFGYLSDDANIFIIISDQGGDGSEFIIGIRGGVTGGGGGGAGGGGGGCFVESLLK